MKLLKNKFVLFVLGLCVLMAAARHFGLDARFMEVEAWVRTLGPWGPLVYVFIDALGTGIAFPASVLTVAAGTLFLHTAGGVLPWHRAGHRDRRKPGLRP